MIADMEEEKKVKKSGTGRYIWRLFYPVLLLFGVQLLAEFVFGFFVSLKYALANPQLYSDIRELLRQSEQYLLGILLENANIISIISSVVAAPLLLLFMHLDTKRSYREGTHETYDKVPAAFYVVVVLLGIATAVTANNLISISGIYQLEAEYQEQLGEIIYSGGIIIELLSVVILGPVVEELCFRGLVYRRMRERASVKFSMFFSALIFAVFHGNIVQGVYAFMLGLLMAYVYEKFKNIVAPILFHVGANLFSVIVTETGVLDFVEESDKAAIIYIAAGAILTLVFLWIVHEKVSPRLLIPSEASQREEPEM